MDNAAKTITAMAIAAMAIAGGEGDCGDDDCSEDDRSEDDRGENDHSGVEQRVPGGLADERGDQTVCDVVRSLVVNTLTRPVAQDQHEARLVNALPKGLGEVRCANRAAHGSTHARAAGSASRSMQRDGTGRVPKTRCKARART